MTEDLRLFLSAGRLEAGVDEAGRGCLAGPVTAAAVIPGPSGAQWLAQGLNDSKKLDEQARNRLRDHIEAEALAWSVGWASVDEIEKVNILQATYLAMHRAVDGLTVRPDHLLIDGNRFRPHDIPIRAKSKGMGAFWPLRQRASSPRPTAMPSWTRCPNSIQSMDGPATRVTPLLPTRRPCACTGTRSTTGSLFEAYRGHYSLLDPLGALVVFISRYERVKPPPYQRVVVRIRPNFEGPIPT